MGRRELLGLDRNTRLLFLIIMLSGAAEGIWYFILPVYIRNLGASPEEVGLTLSSAGIAILLTFLPAGALADRISHKKLIIAIMAITSIPTMLLGQASNWQQIMFLLFFFFASWSVVPISNSYIALTVPQEDHNRVFTYVHLGFMTGVVLLPTIGAWIADRFGMGVVFLLSGLFLVLSIIPAGLLADPKRNSPKAKNDYRLLLDSRGQWALVPYIFLLIFAMSTGMTLIPNYLEEIVGLDLISIGRLGTVEALGGVILGFIFGRLRGRRGLALSQLTMVIGMSLLLLRPGRLSVPLGMFLIGSLSTAYPLVSAILAQITPQQVTGLAFGVQGFLNGLSSLAAPALAGILYAKAPQRPLLFTALTLPFIVVWTLRLKLPRNSNSSVDRIP